MGFGKALCCAVMNSYKTQERLPVYIHTQPWSWKAIFLYLSLGFKLQKRDSFAHYINQYEQAMATLKKFVSVKQVSILEELSEI